MKKLRLALAALLVVMSSWCLTLPAWAGSVAPEVIVQDWYKMVLALVRHTPTYSPPVASRSFAYLGVTTFEAVASGTPHLQTLAGQLNGLKPMPARVANVQYDEAIILQTALSRAAQTYFENTGPTGQRAMKALTAKLHAATSEGVGTEVIARSEAYGEEIAKHVLAWSLDDGGATVENMGFPLTYTLAEGPGKWVPTSTLRQQQFPLLPKWGENRTFAMPSGATCSLPPPPAYSEDTGSAFYKEAFEVYNARKNLTPEQLTIARFWSDDPMLSPTPPGHWISIALTVLERDHKSLEDTVDVLARLGVTLADAFIGCWHSKFEYNLVRPITYIRKFIDKNWDTVMATPPFPEYPSGHSTQSGAAAAVLTAALGSTVAFDDATHVRDGIKARHFSSFDEAAAEAGISRLYGGIHFRSAIDRGLEQGRCIGAYAAALKTRK